MRTAAIIPAYQAEAMIGPLITELGQIWPESNAIFLVDDGSSDETAQRAASAGARVIRHDRNRGKGAALRTGMRAAQTDGFDLAVTLDADGQHPPTEALRLHRCGDDPQSIVIGVRDLHAARAPRANQWSNRFSNLVLSAFTGTHLQDTQCGLRRYPLRATLALGGQDDGYAYEAELLIRAAAAGMTIHHEPIRVIYPPESERLTHFHSVRDPARIVARVVMTTLGVHTPALFKRNKP